GGDCSRALATAAEYHRQRSRRSAPRHPNGRGTDERNCSIVNSIRLAPGAVVRCSRSISPGGAVSAIKFGKVLFHLRRSPVKRRSAYETFARSSAHLPRRHCF